VPTIFDDPSVAGNVVRTYCPAFSPEIIQNAHQQQIQALDARHASLLQGGKMSFEECRFEILELQTRQSRAVERWKNATQVDQLPTAIPEPFVSFIPAFTFNTYSRPPRYFRILVWNLENFTRDQRPNRTGPLDSVRNQARTAIVADAMARLDIDLLLIMETGRDVGTATTRIATAVTDKTRTLRPNDDRPFEPLVSPPTGPLPELLNMYRAPVKRPTMLKVLALRSLFRVFLISPEHPNAPLEVTSNQILSGWDLLRQSSPQAAAVLPPVDQSQLASLLARLLDQLAHARANFVPLGIEDNWDDIFRIACDVADDIGKNQPIQAYPSDIAWAVLSAREAVVAFLGARRQYAELSELFEQEIALCEGIELLLLFAIKQTVRGFPTGGIEASVFRSNASEFGMVPLAVFFAAGAPVLILNAINQEVGPADGTLDNDVLLEALQRVGAITRNIETYGMVYRQQFPQALGHLFEIGVGSLGNLDEEASRYGIVQAPLSHGVNQVQRAGDPLNWRSALQITVPLRPGVDLPLVLYHTRYTGSEAISAMHSEFAQTGQEKTVLARCMSVEQITSALLPGNSKSGLPLIVGDFNIPAQYLNKQPAPSSQDKRSVAAHKRSDDLRSRFANEMASRGYLRHSMTRDPSSDYPLTTLKAFSSIARGGSPLSEPYDGIYQPFDFLRGLAGVASGVIDFAVLLPDSVLASPVTGMQSTDEIGTVDPDSPDSGDLRPMGDQEEEEVPSASPKEVKVTLAVREALALEVGRVYRGILRRVYFEIKIMEPWMNKLPDRKRQPSAGLLKLAEEWRNIFHSFDTGVKHRVNWFEAMCKAGGFEAFQSTTENDFLLHCYTVFFESAALARNENIYNDVLQGLPDLIKDVQLQAGNLETDKAIRLLVAFRAMVSDHLPQLVEIDLEPWLG
jgi:hypothetical protein